MEWEGSLALVLGFSFDLFPVNADLFSPRLNDEAGDERLSGSNGIGEGILEGLGGNVFQRGIPAIVEEFCLGTFRHFLAQGEVGLVDQHRQKSHPGGRDRRR